MSVEENKELVRRYFLADVAEIKAAIAGNDKYHAPEFTIHLSSRDFSLKEYGEIANTLVTAFPDLKYTIEDMVAVGDKVVVRYRFIGTQRGAYRGITPTGKSVNAEGIDIIKIAGSRIVDRGDAFDTLGLMQQLGAIPSGPPKK